MDGCSMLNENGNGNGKESYACNACVLFMLDFPQKIYILHLTCNIVILPSYTRHTPCRECGNYFFLLLLLMCRALLLDVLNAAAVVVVLVDFFSSCDSSRQEQQAVRRVDTAYERKKNLVKHVPVCLSTSRSFFFVLTRLFSNCKNFSRHRMVYTIHVYNGDVLAGCIAVLYTYLHIPLVAF